MEDNSEFHPGSLRIQCNKAIEVIDKENEAYEELISKLRTNIVENETMSGETADSIKAYASDLIFVVEYAIEANELDKVDHQALLDEIDSVLADKVDVNEVLLGYEIHEEINYLEEQISIYEEYINQEILNLNINDLNEIKEVDYREQIEDLESVLQDYKNKEERYDTIEAETKTLFSSTSEIRGIATAAIHEMKRSLINDEYKPSAYYGRKAEFNKINIGSEILDSEDFSDDSKDKVYEFVHDYLSKYFSEEQIVFLYSKKRNLCNNLYATAHWSPADCVTVIKTMEEALVKENELLEKNILNAFDWNYSDEEIKELNCLFQEFGVTDRYSIFCFLMCCGYETGWVDKENQEDNIYYDEHGVAISEDYDGRDVSYTEKERGVGYIQVTGLYTQREAYNALIDLGYITDNEGIGNDVNGYVDVLIQNPWAVSLWYWACNGVVKRGNDRIPLNEYVVSVVGNDDYNHFTLGLPYVCEAFINGKAGPNEVDDAHHAIARGTDANWYVECNPKNDKDWLWYNGENLGFSSIDRFDDLERNYTNTIDYLGLEENNE